MRTNRFRLPVTAAMVVVLVVVASGPVSAAQATFAPAVNYAAGDTPLGMISADFDGDGDADLAAANLNSDDVSVRLGDGNGAFEEARNFGAGDGPQGIVSADFNGDAKLDLAVANDPTEQDRSDEVSVLLGNGDGTFGAAQSFAVQDGPDSLTSADFDADGNADLAVTNHGSASDDPNDPGTYSYKISVLLGEGDGTFRAARNIPAGAGPYGITSADFDGDSKLDLATANKASGSEGVWVLLGNGDGTFEAAQRFEIGGSPRDIINVDFNGDGKLDVAVSNDFGDPGGVGFSSGVFVLLGNGDGTFQSARGFAAGDAPYSVTGADFDGDGNADLATANIFSDDVSVLSGNGDGTFGAAQNFAAGNGPASVTSAGFDNDAKADLAVANAFSDNVSVLMNTTEPNGPPVANDDSYDVKAGKTLNSPAPGVLGNDADPDGDPLTTELVAGPNNGTIELNADGSFAYKPNRRFKGIDSVTYRVSDGRGGADEATITIKVGKTKR